MNIPLKDIPAYCLSHYRNRRNNISSMCSKLNISVTFIDSDTTKFSRQQNIARDTLQLIHTAMFNNIYPFIIFEDDAALIDDVPSHIDIPDNKIDLIYWGAMMYSLPPNIMLSEYNDNYYRILYTQTGHALVIPSPKSALFFKNVLLQSLISNEFSDVILPRISNTKLFLTPKDGPYFYQNDGHNESITNFKYANTNIPMVT